MQTWPSELTPTETSGSSSPTRASKWVFALLVAVLVSTAIGYVALARARDNPQAGSGGDAAVSTGAPALLFQDLATTASGHVGVASLADLDSTRRLTKLRCDRVHYAAGHGLCLANDESKLPPVPQALVFGSDFRVDKEIDLEGLPSRARVSPDGRYGATTSFVTGHAYTDDTYSTRTTLIDMTRGTTIADLEDFTVIRSGRPYTARDVNFWGVTFAENSNRFLATLSTRGRTYMVEGDIAARRVVLGRENVECPSLSPDGMRIGYKKRTNRGSAVPRWRFHVLDLASGQDTPLAETRSVDDQLEWLDDKTLLYGSQESSNAVMAVRADGTGEPRRFLNQARSPTVLRTLPPDPSASDLAEAPRRVNTDLDVSLAATNHGPNGQQYTVSVTNHGPAAATRVVMDYLLSGPGRIVSASAQPAPGGDGYSCSTIPDEARAHCGTGALRARATWTIIVDVASTGSGSLDAKALVSAAEPDPVPDNDIARSRTTVR